MKILFLILFFTTGLYAQNPKHFNPNDTIYIVLKVIYNGTAIREEFDKFHLESFGNDKLNEWMIRDSINRIISIQTFNGDNNNKDLNNIKVKRKKFMRRNKNQIIYFDFIKQFYPDKFFFDYLATNVNRLPKKIIYIIDEDSLKRKDKEIVLKRAAVVPISYAQI